MGKEYTRVFTIAGHPALSPGIICLDDMDQLLKWAQYSGPGDSIFELDPSVSYTGNNSLHLKSRTTTATDGDQIGADRHLHYPSSQKVTYNFLFRPNNPSFTEFISFDCSFFDGVDKHWADIRFYPNVPNWQYLNSGGTYTIIPNSAFKIHTDAWGLFSMTIDFTTKEYVNAIINSHPLLSRRTPIFSDTNGSIEHLFVRLLLEAIGANPVEIYLDSFTAIEI